MSLISTPLDVINKQSETHSYSVDDIDWNLSVNKNIFWAPENLISISHLPIYSELSNEFKVVFNQYNSLGIAEIFMLFEEYALAPSMSKALERADSEELKIALQNFVDEEYKHSLCFKKLLLQAAPNLYHPENFKFRFIRLSPVGRFLFSTLKRFPVLIPSWVWLAIFFEERTLMFSREYIRANKVDSQKLDQLFYQVHYYHMIDEVRHVKLDEHLIKNYYKTFGQIHSRFVAWVVYKFIRRSVYPINMIQSCLKHIRMYQPHLITAEIEEKIYSQATDLPQNKSFLEQNFSENAAPRTRHLMEQYSEFKQFWSDVTKIVQ